MMYLMKLERLGLVEWGRCPGFLNTLSISVIHFWFWYQRIVLMLMDISVSFLHIFSSLSLSGSIPLPFQILNFLSMVEVTYFLVAVSFIL